MSKVATYFPQLTAKQVSQFEKLPEIYAEWNAQINVISRKDMDHFFERHVLHSLSIAKQFSFSKGVSILDIGTGGGFPGIPLAIFFPEVNFVLADSIGKKTKVAQAAAEALGLKNVEVINARVETLNRKFDFIVSRAVAPLSKLLGWTKNQLEKGFDIELEHGFICIKGGDLEEEIKESKSTCRVFELSDWFEDPFFETKKLLYLPKSGIGKGGK